MHSDTAASPAGRHPPDLDSDYHSDDDQEASGRAGKRRRLVSVSCEVCKQRKVKCDRGQPACGWCARNGAVCEYKERKRPGLRAGFGKELQDRMDKLEAILRSHSEILEASLPNHAGSRTGGLFCGRNASLPSDQGTPREPSQMYKPAEPVNTPQVDAALSLSRPAAFTPTSQSTDYGTSSAPAIHDSLRSQMQCSTVSSPLQLPPIQTTMSAHDPYGSAQPGEPSSISNLPLATSNPPGDQDMPPYDLLYTLVDLYFKHINTWCPILHRRTTLELLFGPSTLQEADRILLHAIVATTMRYCTDPRLTRERRQHYHRISKGRVLLYGMENSSVKSLQALVILALDLCGSLNGPPGWNIMALITRAVVQLGLAVESNSFSVAPRFKSIYTLRALILAEPKDFIEEESRRRLFWMVYMLDRYATIATAFEFALSDKEIDRKLPCREELWFQNQKVETTWFTDGDQVAGTPEHKASSPENLGAFAHYMEVLGIFSKIHVFLKQPVDISAVGDVERWKRRYKELDNMLVSWMAGLPSEFGDMTKLFQPGAINNVSCSWMMMHATFHTAVIRLHSSAAYPTARSNVFTPSAGAAHLCLRAVERVAALAEVVVNNGMLSKLGPPFAFTIWVCARLLLVHGSTIENAVSARISFFVDTLREIGRYWQVAARYCGLLEMVLDEHADSQRQGGKVMPSSVKILSDMRRTAFDLDLLISRQPRQGPPHALTPTKTPDQNELEYLDVFDFFNVPRLALGGDGTAMSHEATMDGQSGGAEQPSGPLNEFNITNFMVDANSDWLFKQEHAKFG
ncbi:fungal specific transcription factor [Hirsutella rhossiliensis]|uniref:Fungal specific transcription factor domain-containing protein n=1 Tax=Hirsutella rhossiliensis TaxID=111463 RepID=A0A9P8N371_9HYPO|nr:fungal specific transcription factor domain-containing protein [Hirsutella rhossiliensis]KAH0967478.1 fungal specific transcription factor domain-containing protein [Hirsutella rhossiliensis]